MGDWRLSSRSQKGSGDVGMLEAYMKYDRNMYHQRDNPNGIVSIGVSHNGSILDIIQERLSRPDCHQWSERLTRYGTAIAPSYTNAFTSALSSFLTWRLKPVQPISPSDIIVHNGVGTSLDCFCHAALDPGDYVLIPTPYYGGFDFDVYMGAGVKVYPVNCSSDTEYLPTIALLGEALAKARNEGCNVKGLIITNPGNPVGQVLTRESIQEMIHFCHRNQLHYISDEIYMNSVHDVDTEFVSALSISNIPDPNTVHVLWGFSKDFGLPGFQVGCFVTHFKAMKGYMNTKAFLFCRVGSYIQQMLTVMLNDREWLEQVFFPTCLKRLREQLGITITWLEQNGVSFIRPKGGLFVYANFSNFLDASTHEAEAVLGERFFDAGVYITPSKAFHGVEPGWFRMVFAEDPSLLQLALQRLQTIDVWKK